MQDSHSDNTPQENEFLTTHKITNCDIEYDLFCCQDCTESLCLDIKGKNYVLEKLHSLVITLSMDKYYNKGK